MCDMTHSYVWHDAFICVTWRIHMCDMTHSYVWHDSRKRVTTLIHMCDMTHSYVWHDSFICVTCLNYIRDMTHSHMIWLFTSVICKGGGSGMWLGPFHMYDMTFKCVTWLNCMFDIPPLQEEFICVTWRDSPPLQFLRYCRVLLVQCASVECRASFLHHVSNVCLECRALRLYMSHISMSHVAHMNESCHTYECVMYVSNVEPWGSTCDRM